MDEVVLVTGSSGLIGKAVCKALAGQYKVIGLDKEGAPYPPEEAEWLFVDMTSDESMQLAFHLVEDRYGSNIASVIHLAAYYDFGGEPSKLYEEINVKGSERLLRELGRFNVQQLLFAGSMVEHKPVAPGQVITEDSPLEGTWDYPVSKIKTEQLLTDARRKFPLVTLRIAGVYDEWCHSIPIAHQIQRIYEKKITSHFYPGDQDAGQSFVHLADLIKALELTVAARHSLPDKSVFLIGEEEVLSYSQMQDAIGELLYGHHWETIKIPKPIAKAGAWVQDKVQEHAFIKPWMVDRADDHYAISVERARRELGWNPRYKLREVLSQMIDNLKADPQRWYHENHLDAPPAVKRSA